MRKSRTLLGPSVVVLLKLFSSNLFAAMPEPAKPTVVLPPAPTSRTLKGAYQAAVEVSETMNIQYELLTQANETNTQAKGALFPTITGSYKFLNQPAPQTSIGSITSPSSQNTALITATQPIFRGLRDFAALRQKKVLVGSQQFALQTAARQLFYDVSTAYYNVLGFLDDERNYQYEIELNQQRLKELEDFFKIGRAQLTDVLTFKSNIASLEAQLETTHGQLESAKDILAYFTGWKRDFALKDNESPLLEVGEVEPYLAKIEERPDVKAAVSNLQANEEAEPIAFGQHLPTADLIGNYYLTRPGALSDVHWDVQVSLTLPLFQGGIIQSQVRQAQSISRQYGQILSQTRRTAEQEIRTFYDTLRADVKKLGKLTELASIAKQNADTQVKYYRNGLVTNLDVLTSITTYQDAQRQLDRQNSVIRLDTVKLQAASGQRDELNSSEKIKP